MTPQTPQASTQKLLETMSLRSDGESHMLLSYIRQLQSDNAKMREALEKYHGWMNGGKKQTAYGKIVDHVLSSLSS